MPPILTAQGSTARRFASPPARWASWFGLAALGCLAFVSAGWTALFLLLAATGIRTRHRTEQRRWELDAPGPDARFRFGPRASKSVRIADLAGVVVVGVRGAETEEMPVINHHEQWWLVDAEGRSLGRASTEGLEPELVERFRSALGVLFVPAGVARLAGALPEGMPWWARRPKLTLLFATVATALGMLAVIAVPPYWS